MQCRKQAGGARGSGLMRAKVSLFHGDGTNDHEVVTLHSRNLLRNSVLVEDDREIGDHSGGLCGHIRSLGLTGRGDLYRFCASSAALAGRAIEPTLSPKRSQHWHLSL